MKRLSFLLLLSAALLAAKPNFSGNWKLDTAKSDFGAMPAPESLSMKVEHSDPGLKVTQTQTGGPMGGFTAEYSYSTDGAPTRFNVRGNELNAVARWDGDTLKITTKMTLQGNEITTTDVWKSASGGRVIEVSRTVTSGPGAAASIKFVFNKEK